VWLTVAGFFEWDRLHLSRTQRGGVQLWSLEVQGPGSDSEEKRGMMAATKTLCRANLAKRAHDIGPEAREHHDVCSRSGWRGGMLQGISFGTGSFHGSAVSSPGLRETARWSASLP
jgi:hypothetical protein